VYPAGVTGIKVRRVAIRDGVSLRVLEAGPSSENAVVLLHGWASSVYSFDATIPALVAAGHRVVAIDLPGHGLSDKPSDRTWYSVPAMADAVATVIRESAIKRYAVVAHSMSGAIALHLSTRVNAPAAIVFVGAVGVGHVPLAWLARFLTPRFVATLLPGLIGRPVGRFVAGLAFGVKDRPTERDVDEYWAPTQFDAFSRALVSCLHRADWHREDDRLRGLQVPALVIAGGRDRVAQGVAAGGKMIPGARVIDVREAGHLVMQECASEVNPEIVSFLATTFG
jgi:pimeloyl-ACP methyl ester carboxylesterase